MPRNFLPEQTALSQKLINSFQEFLYTHPPYQVSRHIRYLLLDFIRIKLDTGLPIDFSSYLEELYDLFNLLEEAGEEISQSKFGNSAI